MQHSSITHQKKRTETPLYSPQQSINSLSVLVTGRGHRLEMKPYPAEPSSPGGWASVSGSHCLGNGRGTFALRSVQS